MIFSRFLVRKIAFLQLAELFLSANDAVKNDIAPIDTTHLLVFCAFPVLAYGIQAFVEIPMCLEDHAEVLGAALKEELERRHPIQKDTVKNSTMYSLFGQVLHQERKVVAKVQISLAR